MSDFLGLCLAPRPHVLTEKHPVYPSALFLSRGMVQIVYIQYFPLQPLCNLLIKNVFTYVFERGWARLPGYNDVM
jgi:hypothetical protein